MNSTDVIDLARQAVQMVFVLSLPVLATAFVAGLLVSALQAMTQIHDQSIGTVIKLVCIFIVVMLCLPWLLEMVTDYGSEVVESIPANFKGTSGGGIGF